MSALNKVVGWFESLASRMTYRDMESYLSQSQNISDLEARMKKWEIAQSRQGNFHWS